VRCLRGRARVVSRGSLGSRDGMVTGEGGGHAEIWVGKSIRLGVYLERGKRLRLVAGRGVVEAVCLFVYVRKAISWACESRFRREK